MRRLIPPSGVGTANWSEIAQKVLARGRSWDLTRALLASYDLRSEPVSIDDAERAARAWGAGDGRSLGDRLWLALGERLDTDVLTADRGWGTSGRIRQIR